jgi:hypothetical protein
MLDVPLNVADDMTGVSFKPTAIEIFRHCAQLNGQIGTEVLWGYLTALFSPETHQGWLVITHDGAGVGSTDEGTAVRGSRHCKFLLMIYM